MNNLPSRNQPFGRARPEARTSAEELAAALLRRRIEEKIQNYELEAGRLALRGKGDAAEVLRRAAVRLKLLKRVDGSGDAA